jgi:hypothetical protein
MVKYTLEQQIFLYDSYVKKKSFKSCKRRFRHRYPGVRIPASSTILRLVKKKCIQLGLSQTRNTLDGMLC